MKMTDDDHDDDDSAIAMIFHDFSLRNQTVANESVSESFSPSS